MQLSRWIDGNSVEVEDGWVSVEVNCHLTDGEENTARPKKFLIFFGEIGTYVNGVTEREKKNLKNPASFMSLNF